jgi:CRISPR/Cas system CSM-associated protein Csm3 (group 7 of RAMP superfamily)
MSGIYRTLVRGKLRQESSLCVGGTLPALGGADAVCARDGLGRLTIPGTALAGCLIDTAARVLPGMFAEGERPDEHLRRVTSKRKKGAPRETWESLWRFLPAHRKNDRIERRQGVGIRHETGAAAGEGAALFDIETLPPGEEWGFFLEIDTLRGGPRVEEAALLALAEWEQGRCWLGAGAARGLGWMRLVEAEVLRLPRREEAVRAWPDSSRGLDAVWPELSRISPPVRGIAGLAQGLRSGLPRERTCLAILDVEVKAGEAADGYGLDALSFGMHAAGLLEPLAVMPPFGMDATKHREEHEPDCPVAVSGESASSLRPVLPGSGLRGPLRHAASRLARTAGLTVPDPNTRTDGSPPRESADPVSELFGLTGHSARLLVSDARPLGGCDVACWQHHAADEFAGGVFLHGKFDRTSVLRGELAFRLAIEAPNAATMVESLKALEGAARLAELGFAPVGGAKTRGAGWVAWRFTRIQHGLAGDELVSRPINGDVVPALREAAARFTGGAS